MLFTDPRNKKVAGTFIAATFLSFAGKQASRGIRGQRAAVLPVVVREGFVRLCHTVYVFFFLDGVSAVVSGVDEFAS